MGRIEIELQPPVEIRAAAMIRESEAGEARA